MTAFDTLFWLLVVMLAVVAYAVEAGIAVRHRPAVLTTMFSVVAAVLYIMVIGEDMSFGRSGKLPGLDIPLPTVELPKVDAKEAIDPGGGLAGIFAAPKPAYSSDKPLPKGPFSDCDNCPSMIAIPPGKYTMGSDPTEPGRRDNEGPVFVSIDYPFAAGRFEITRDQFALFVEDSKHVVGSGCMVNGRNSSSASWINPGFEQAGNHPVVCVSWRDARAYAAWLSKKSKQTYRLLSEAEWEYMARGGVTTTYTHGNVLGTSHANFNRNRDGTIPIGFTSANSFGVHDVLGNAWEIVDDCWNAELSFNNFDGRPTIMRGDCSQRVVRGGGWSSSAAQARLAARTAFDSGAAAHTVGFRVARVFD